MQCPFPFDRRLKNAQDLRPIPFSLRTCACVQQLGMGYVLLVRIVCVCVCVSLFFLFFFL
jgi:hypothetical protein